MLWDKCRNKQLIHTFWHSSGHNKTSAVLNECTLFKNYGVGATPAEYKAPFSLNERMMPNFFYIMSCY